MDVFLRAFQTFHHSFIPPFTWQNTLDMKEKNILIVHSSHGFSKRNIHLVPLVDHLQKIPAKDTRMTLKEWSFLSRSFRRELAFRLPRGGFQNRYRRPFFFHPTRLSKGLSIPP
ncbi:hypothetical protein NPIL_489021 [Nephila pilipes]|uniref:Uncharacterized protein n=1 Tax=Nephila pilipes TaxID=299642 RepID=A0A8X6T2E4_NEPPI|nr:hypothetical protein NPIL_489021 [Nephila pilipes]